MENIVVGTCLAKVAICFIAGLCIIVTAILVYNEEHPDNFFQNIKVN